MRHQNARARADSRPLDASIIRKVVQPLFRCRNDYSLATFDELPCELGRFGISTVKHLRLLMKKHRRTLLAAENIRISRAEMRWLSQERSFGGLDTFAGKSWFALPGLIREAMVLEFGDHAAILTRA